MKLKKFKIVAISVGISFAIVSGISYYKINLDKLSNKDKSCQISIEQKKGLNKLNLYIDSFSCACVGFLFGSISTLVIKKITK